MLQLRRRVFVPDHFCPREPYAREFHFAGMKHRHHPEDEGTGGAGAVGLCVTILASLMAFSVGEAGLFEGPPKARMVFIEKSESAGPAIIPETAQSSGGFEIAVQGETKTSPTITERRAGGG